MVNLYNKTTGTLIGSISDQQLQYLTDQMEEESLEDRDYSITAMEIAYFESQGADNGLLDLLRQALGAENEVIIQWERS